MRCARASVKTGLSSRKTFSDKQNWEWTRLFQFCFQLRYNWSTEIRNWLFKRKFRWQSRFGRFQMNNGLRSKFNSQKQLWMSSELVRCVHIRRIDSPNWNRKHADGRNAIENKIVSWQKVISSAVGIIYRSNNGEISGEKKNHNIWQEVNTTNWHRIETNLFCAHFMFHRRSFDESNRRIHCVVTNRPSFKSTSSVVAMQCRLNHVTTCSCQWQSDKCTKHLWIGSRTMMNCDSISIKCDFQSFNDGKRNQNVALTTLGRYLRHRLISDLLWILQRGIADSKQTASHASFPFISCVNFDVDSWRWKRSKINEIGSFLS